MRSSYIANYTRAPVTTKSRTPKHELIILRKSIEILKDDACHAEALRLKATRLKEQKKLEWENLLTELETLKEEITEGSLLAEFLTEDIEAIQIKIQKKERKSRLSCTSTERIVNMEESLKEKKITLCKSVELETVRKKELEEHITNYELHQKISKIWNPEHVSEYEDSCVIPISNEDDGGAGDIHDSMHDLLHTLSRSYEDICNQRETLEQEVNFIDIKLKEIRVDVETTRSEVKVMKAELHLKERQLFDTETQKDKTLRLTQAKEKICEEAENRFEEAENLSLLANDRIKIIKLLIREKNDERATLEKIIERENQILELKEFSQNVSESIPIQIHEHYCSMEPKIIKYLNNVIKGSTEVIPRLFWTDDLENLTIRFKDRIEEFKSNAPSESTTESYVKVFPNGCGQSSQKGQRNIERLESEAYRPPSLPLKKLINYQQSKSSILKKPLAFKSTNIKKKNRISPTKSNMTLPSLHSPSIGGLRKLFLNVCSSLAPGIDNYPKTVVINDVMYRLRDRISTPEKIHGPLTFRVWKRHEADKRKPLKFSQSGISYRLCKLFFGSQYSDT